MINVREARACARACARVFPRRRRGKKDLGKKRSRTDKRDHPTKPIKRSNVRVSCPRVFCINYSVGTRSSHYTRHSETRNHRSKLLTAIKVPYRQKLCNFCYRPIVSRVSRLFFFFPVIRDKSCLLKTGRLRGRLFDKKRSCRKAVTKNWK